MRSASIIILVTIILTVSAHTRLITETSYEECPPKSIEDVNTLIEEWLSSHKFSETRTFTTQELTAYINAVIEHKIPTNEYQDLNDIEVEYDPIPDLIRDLVREMVKVDRNESQGARQKSSYHLPHLKDLIADHKEAVTKSKEETSGALRTLLVADDYLSRSEIYLALARMLYWIQSRKSFNSRFDLSRLIGMAIDLSNEYRLSEVWYRRLLSKHHGEALLFPVEGQLTPLINKAKLPKTRAAIWLGVGPILQKMHFRETDDVERARRIQNLNQYIHEMVAGEDADSSNQQMES